MSININNVSLEELKGITGISDRRAQKIIKIREGSPLTLEIDVRHTKHHVGSTHTKWRSHLRTRGAGL